MNLKLLKHPILTEKSVRQKDEQNKVTFRVDPKANKTEIKKIVERLFKVTVLDIRTARMKGKMKRVGRHVGKRPDWKKAILTLKEGDRIEYFEGA